jgi:hypothetical protein
MVSDKIKSLKVFFYIFIFLSQKDKKEKNLHYE